jgi:hypothetical protein
VTVLGEQTVESAEAAELDVFLSYARDDDEQFVAYLRDYLVERGLKVWFDRRSMPSLGSPFSTEIQKAIERAARLALIVGPKALESPYVNNEWEFALLEGKVVTPLVRGPYPNDEAVKFGDVLSGLPRRLRRLHTVDCRKHRPEMDALEEVARLLGERLGQLGQLHHVARFPDWYIWRNDLLERVIDAIGSSDAISVFNSDTAPTGRQTYQQRQSAYARPIAIQGMGGAGKTLLAQAVVRDGGVRRLFPDGIFWVDIGKTPAIPARQAEIGAAFGGRSDEFPDDRRGKERLTTLLADKAALLILDDVWELEHARAFQVDAPGCRILLTTRSRSIARQLNAVGSESDASAEQAVALQPDVLTEDEALELLTVRLPTATEIDNHAAHVRLVRLLGCHAQAIALAAAWLDDHARSTGGFVDQTAEYLLRLDQRRATATPFADLVIEHGDRNQNLELSLDLSYATLNADAQRRFRALGAFADGISFETTAAATIWAQPTLDAENSLDALFQAALLDRLEFGHYRQHMLLRMYARALLSRDPSELTTARQRHHDHYLQRLQAPAPPEADITQALFALEGADDKLPLIQALIPHLSSSPYVWSGVHSALVHTLASVEQPASSTSSSVWQLVDSLVRSREGLSNRLVVAALAEHCRAHPTGAAIGQLDTWLRASGTRQSSLAARSAAQVAVLCHHETLLQHALTHHSESVRNIVINDAHQLWKDDPDLTRRLLNFLTGHITFRQILNWKELTYVATAAVNLSILVVARDYADLGMTGDGTTPGGAAEAASRQSLEMVQAAWKPVIRDCLMVNRNPLLGPVARQVRRTLIGLLARITTNKIRAIGKREYFTFSFEDVEQFFPATEEHRQIVDRLIDYIGPEASHSLEDLTNYIYELAVRGLTEVELNNWIIVNAAHLALLAHMHRAPIATADAIFDLLCRIEPLYPETIDPASPTARLWYLVCTFPYLSFPYTDSPEGRKALRQFMDVSLVAEMRFRNSWQCSAGRRVLRVSNIEQYLFGYKIGVDELGKDVLEQTILFDLDKDDREHIAWTPYSVAIGMLRYQAPSAGIAALEDLISLLYRHDYFENLSDKDLRAFWEKAADDLILYAAEYQPAFMALIKRWRDSEIPKRLKDALQDTENRMQVHLSNQTSADEEDADAPDSQIGEAVAWALRNALYDRDQSFRELLRWFFHELARARNPEDVMSVLMQRLINTIYGEDIF